VQGVVVVYNLDPDTTNEQLVWMFSRFGEVKDIQQAPQRSNQKFIEFFDVRHAAAALRAMNRAELSRLPGCSVAGSSSSAAAAAGDSSDGLLGGSSTQLHRGSGDGGNFLSPGAAQQQRAHGSSGSLAAAMQQLGLDGQQQPSQVQNIARAPSYDPVAHMSQRGLVRPVSGMLDRMHAAAVSPPMSMGPLSQSWDNTSTGPESMLNMLTRQQQQQQQGAGQHQQQQPTALQQLQQQQQQHQQQMFLQQALGLLRGSRQDLSTLVSAWLGVMAVGPEFCMLATSCTLLLAGLAAVVHQQLCREQTTHGCMTAVICRPLQKPCSRILLVCHALVSAGPSARDHHS
jgi:hypothetical protein